MLTWIGCLYRNVIYWKSPTNFTLSNLDIKPLASSKESYSIIRKKTHDILFYTTGTANSCNEQDFIITPPPVTQPPPTVPPPITLPPSHPEPSQPIEVVDEIDNDMDTTDDNSCNTNQSPIPSTSSGCSPSCSSSTNADSSFEDMQVETALDEQEKATGVRPENIDLDNMELTDFPYKEEYGKVIDQYLSGKLDKDTFLANKNWLELYINKQDPSKSALRCKYCYHYEDVFSIVPRTKNLLATEKGAIKLTKGENNKMIRDHLHTVTHDEIEKSLKERKIDELYNVKRSEPRHHKVTNNIYRSIYYEIMTGLSFNSHHSLVELQEQNGAVMGNMCRNKDTAKKMTIHLSEEMHKELLAYLKEKKPHLSLIMDGSEYLMSLYMAMLKT